MERLTDWQPHGKGFGAMTVSSLARPKESVRGGGDACVASGFEITPATSADHQAIHQFLLQVFQQPSASEFQAQLDHPGYEPRQRLLVKYDGRIVAHLRIVPRALHFGGMILPAAYVTDLGTSPEFRGHRLASNLLALAEHRMLSDGALFGYLRARRTGFYASKGWIELGAAPHCIASPQAVLAHLDQGQPKRRNLAREQARPLRLRHWRHFEQEALERLYGAHCQRAFGGVVRDSDYWNWLITRHAFDGIYVALDGPPRMELDQIPDAVVGYAATARSRLVELMIDPRRADAAGTLIARFCRDAIEQNRYQIRLDAPPDSPFRAFFPGRVEDSADSLDSADATRFREPVIMVRAISMGRLASHLHEVFLQRLVEAGRRLPAELGFFADGQEYVLRVDETRTRLLPEGRPRQHLTGNPSDLLRLLLGGLEPAEAVAGGRIQASSQAALRTAGILLAKTPLWFPPLDDLTG